MVEAQTRYLVPQSLIKLAYKTLQGGKGLAGLVHKELSTKAMELLAPEAAPPTEPIKADLLKELRNSMTALEQVDWQEAENGIYPITQLFEAPWLDWATIYPLIWLDLPSTWNRRKKKKTRDIPKKINRNVYPDYYLQNFHHQTDGYLSDKSADLYDLQVEILFNGTADAMRRRILAPLKRGLKKFSERPLESLRVLDVATGTGRTLQQIKTALPEVELIGIDLSEAYLRHANRCLTNKNHGLTQLVRGNAEDLPFATESMQAVTCVFLLHELPGHARQNVLNECWRVLEPGGVLILADSIQISDSPKFSLLMDNFPKLFHEPYYKSYVNDDINQRLKNIGFEGITAQSHFMTRVWKANKAIKKKIY